ncbi:MAG: ankyrin repeat domain-containing protein, partial [Bacteroidales bacterium]|nr:ankyrin repeat domain-containing protein [Bacteroidales bacterium]
ATNGNFAVAYILVSNRADINAKDNRGETPIHLAIRIGHLSNDPGGFLVAYLESHGAD